ncbi:MAG TPA: glycosyl transferase [Cyclobacteriaceae bacterium]
MTEKKVLIIAYYWPPSGGSGVQRWLKFVKYLPQAGFKPYVFTPKNPSFAVQDQSLLKDVPVEAEIIHFPIWEPYEAFFKLSSFFGDKSKSAKPTALVSGKKKSFFQNISTWIRGNFFIPDPRVFWVKPSVKFLEKYLAENNISTIITTGPPHSVHLIGYRLRKKNKSLRWLADFRDPWTEWGFLDSLMVGKIARKVHKRLENKVLSTADEIITITPFYVRRFETLSKRNVRLLTNGFDEDDFKNIAYRKNEKFLIWHVGIINEKCDPRPFILAVVALMEQNQDFKSNVVIEFIGEVHPDIKSFVQNYPALSTVIRYTGNIPHKELISRYGESPLLLLILNGYKNAEGYLPGKLFEYVATGLPVFAVGPTDGDAAALLKETQAGYMFESDDHQGMIDRLEIEFNNWKLSDQPLVKQYASNIYSRQAITQKLAKLI